MKALVIIFIIISSLSALSAMSYVVVDIVIEKLKGQREPEPVYVPVPVPVPEPEPEPEPEPVIVEQVDAIEADALMTDDAALGRIKREPGGGSGYRGFINIGVIDQNFEAGDVVTLDKLKALGLIEKKAGRVKILADGVLSRPLTIKADSFSIQAIKMIDLTGGVPIILE